MTTPPIRIIYNPNSTGPSGELADELRARLEARYPETDVATLATGHAGHGEEIGRRYALEGEPTILVSSSGDGGYHDMINGMLAAGGSEAIIAGLLPGGNANDHYNALHHDDVIERLHNVQFDTIDIIRVDAEVDGQPWTRYAHSYAGVGLTARIGETLTKAKLNRYREAWIVMTHLFAHSPIKLRVGGKLRRYDSIIFSNIPRMSKVLSLTDNASLTDGTMEVTILESRTIVTMIAHLLRGALRGFKTELRVDRYEFTCHRRTPMQLDGEIYYFSAGTTVRVTVEPKLLKCIV